MKKANKHFFKFIILDAKVDTIYYDFRSFSYDVQSVTWVIYSLYTLSLAFASIE